MNNQISTVAWKKFARTLLAIVLVLAVANLAITYLLGWPGLAGYGDGLIFAGLSVIGLGVISLTGERSVGMGSSGLGQLVMPSPLVAPVWLKRSAAIEDPAFVAPLLAAGVIAIALGVVLLRLG